MKPARKTFLLLLLFFSSFSLPGTGATEHLLAHPQKPQHQTMVLKRFIAATGEELQATLVHVNGKRYTGRMDSLNLNTIYMYRKTDGKEAMETYGPEARYGLLELYTYPGMDVNQPWGAVLNPAYDATFRRGDAEIFSKWIERRIPRKGTIPHYVMLSLLIDQQGNVADVLLLNNCHKTISDRVIEQVARSPRWMPASDEWGRSIASRVDVTILAYTNFSELAAFVPAAPQLEAYNYPVRAIPPRYKKQGLYFATEMIYRKMRFPRQVRKTHTQGEVSAVYSLDENGKIVRVQILKATHPAFGQEVERVVRTLTDWVPAYDEYGNKIPFDVPVTLYFER